MDNPSLNNRTGGFTRMVAVERSVLPVGSVHERLNGWFYQNGGDITIWATIQPRPISRLHEFHQKKTQNEMSCSGAYILAWTGAVPH